MKTVTAGTQNKAAFSQFIISFETIKLIYSYNIEQSDIIYIKKEKKKR